MRILLLSPCPPMPCRHGTAHRAAGWIDGLAGSHALGLLAIARADEPVDRRWLGERCERVEIAEPEPRGPVRRLLELASGRADLAGRLRSPMLATRLRAELATGGWDAVHVIGLELAAFAFAVGDAAGRRPVRLVFDAQNVESELQERLAALDAGAPRRWPRAAYSRLQARRLARLERALAATADAVVCVSTRDAEVLARRVAGLRPAVVPHGVAAPGGPPAPLPVASPAPRIALVATLSYRPNRDGVGWLLREVWPRVRAALPEAQLDLVGGGAPRDLLRGDAPGVRLHGPVAEVGPVLASASAVVVPLRAGSGTRIKILEAMAFGRPVASTSIGAEGLDVEDGRELLVADTPAALAGALVRLATDTELARRLADAARRFVLAHHTWPALAGPMRDLYASLARAPASAS